jgi:hypothetical protein
VRELGEQPSLVVVQLGQHGRDVGVDQFGRRPAESCGEQPARLTGRRHHGELLGPPGEREPQQGVERGADPFRIGVGPDDGQYLGLGHRLVVGVGHHERVEHGEGERVQPLGRSADRRPGAGPRREHRGIRRWGRGEVGARLEQIRQSLVVLGAQPLGEGWAGHPTTVYADAAAPRLR